MHYPEAITVTRLLHEAQAGNRKAINKLFPLVYQALYDQARHHRQRWQGNHTVNTTALVHEAYLKLVDQTQVSWKSRAHFMGVASKAMRHILMDYARYSQRQKRGGDVRKISVDEVRFVSLISDSMPAVDERADVFVAMDDALNRLAGISERQARMVECRFFGGMTIAETAEALEVSPATVKRDWVMAQAWLYREMKKMVA